MAVNRRTRTHRSTGSARRSQSERRETTRQALLDAALDALGSGLSFDRLSLRRVTQSAGVSPGAFYRYFATMGRARPRTRRRVRRRECRERCCARHARAVSPRTLCDLPLSGDPAHPRPRAPPPLRLSRARPLIGQRGPAAHDPRGDPALRLRAGHGPGALPGPAREWSTDDPPTPSGLFVDVMIAAIEPMLEATAGAPPRAADRRRRIRNLPAHRAAVTADRARHPPVAQRRVGRA